MKLMKFLLNWRVKNVDLSSAENSFKRLLNLNKHIESLLKKKSRSITNEKVKKIND